MTIKREMFIEPQFLTASAATVYTVSTGQEANIEKLSAHNSDTSARTLTLWFVPNGDTRGDEHTVVKELSIDPDDTVDIPQAAHALNAGMAVDGVASVADKVAIKASGWRRS